MSRAKTSQKSQKAAEERWNKKRNIWTAARNCFWNSSFTYRQLFFVKRAKNVKKGKHIQLLLTHTTIGAIVVWKFSVTSLWAHVIKQWQCICLAVVGGTNKLFGRFSVKLSLRSSLKPKGWNLRFAFFHVEFTGALFYWSSVLNKQVKIMRQLVRSITYYKTNICRTTKQWQNNCIW